MYLSSVASIQKRYQHVYLSPHLDDVAFSCAGRIARQRRAGETVLVVTIFTGEISDVERSRYNLFNDYADTKKRKAEDTSAMEILDADYLWLGYPDDLFRHKGRVLGQLRYFFPPFGKEKKVCEDVFSDIVKICNDSKAGNVYVPFGAGYHRDHRLTFAIGNRLREALGKNLLMLFYEDIPYVFIANALKYRMKGVGASYDTTQSARDLSQIKLFRQEVFETYRSIASVHFLSIHLKGSFSRGLLLLLLVVFFAANLPRRWKRTAGRLRLMPEIWDITAELKKKMEAAESYCSQVRLLVGDMERFKTHLQNYSWAMECANNRYLERYWRVMS